MQDTGWFYLPYKGMLRERVLPETTATCHTHTPLTEGRPSSFSAAATTIGGASMRHFWAFCNCGVCVHTSFMTSVPPCEHLGHGLRQPLPCAITAGGRTALLHGLATACTLPSERARPLHEAAPHGVKALEEIRTPEGHPRSHERHAQERAQTAQGGGGD